MFWARLRYTRLSCGVQYFKYIKCLFDFMMQSHWDAVMLWVKEDLYGFSHDSAIWAGISEVVLLVLPGVSDARVFIWWAVITKLASQCALRGLTSLSTSLLSPAGQLDFLVAWNLGSKRENSKMTSAYQISPCISLQLSHLPKPSHTIKLRSSVERSNTRAGILRGVVHEESLMYSSRTSS